MPEVVTAKIEPHGSAAHSSAGGPRVLVVDDDSDLRELLRVALTQEGFNLELVGDGPSAIESMQGRPADLVLLDVMMPGMDGIETCKAIRQRSAVPIIMLTARRNETDVINGLEAGADDYVTKPFSIRELTARIRSTLRRIDLDTGTAGRASRQVFDGGRLVLDAPKRRIELEGKVVPLSRTEFALLRLLMSQTGKVVSHEALMQHLWRTSGPAEQARLRTFMGLLRRKLGERGRSGRYLHSHHGSGYRFESTAPKSDADPRGGRQPQAPGA